MSYDLPLIPSPRRMFLCKFDMKFAHSRLIRLSMVAVSLTATSCLAQTSLYYKNSSGGNWNTAANWTSSNVPNDDAEHAFIGTTSTLDTDDVRVNFNIPTSPKIYGLTIGPSSRLNHSSGIMTSSLTISTVLDNDGQIWLPSPNSNGCTHIIAYTGSSLAESSGSFTLDHKALGAPANRVIQLELASGNVNRSTITVISRSEGVAISNQANLVLAGSDTFINQKTVAVFNSTSGSFATAAGATATYRQSGASAKTLLGALSTSTASTAMNAQMTMAAIAIDDGEFIGNGRVVSTGWFWLGNSDEVQATLRINGLTVTGTTTASASDATIGEDDEIATMTVGVPGGQTTTLALNSDVIVEMQLNLLTKKADKIDVFGDVRIAEGARLSVSLFLVDVALAKGTRFSLIKYSGSLTGNFTGLSDGTVFTIGGNSYRIDYDGNFTTGDFTGGKDVMLTAVGSALR